MVKKRRPQSTPPNAGTRDHSSVRLQLHEYSNPVKYCLYNTIAICANVISTALPHHCATVARSLERAPVGRRLRSALAAAPENVHALEGQAGCGARVAYAPRLRLRQAFSRMLWSQNSKR